MIDLIHIGDYKTGASWLQDQLFLNHPDLYCSDSDRHPEVVNLMHQLVETHKVMWNFPFIWESWEVK